MTTYSVNPKVLIWARKEARLDRAIAADLLRSCLGEDAEEKLAALESDFNAPEPTLSILEGMSKVYKVSIITLCRPSVPPHSKKSVDFRTIKGRSPTMGRDTVNAVRSTQRFIEDMEDLIQNTPNLYQSVNLPHLNISDDVSNAANIERTRLGITIQMQHNWKDTDAAFEAWRWSIERLGILVFAFRMPMADCRGFVLNGNALSAIAVNYNDDSGAQVFTLFHEYAHILLRQFGICGRAEDVDELNIEKFANNFAANLLMPEDQVIELAELSSLNTQTQSRFDIVLDAAKTIASYLNVSVEAAVLRLERLGKVPPGSHEKYVSVARGKRRPRGGIAPYYHRYLNKFGNRYLSTILTALNKNYIDAVDAYHMLGGVKSRHFRDFQADLAQREKIYSNKAST